MWINSPTPTPEPGQTIEIATYFAETLNRSVKLG